MVQMESVLVLAVHVRVGTWNRAEEAEEAEEAEDGTQEAPPCRFRERKGPNARTSFPLTQLGLPPPSSLVAAA
jgi:hypothetical protein